MDEAVTFHKCLLHYPLHKLCFCFDQVITPFFIVVVILANSQVSVYGTISPLVIFRGIRSKISFLF